MARKLFGSARGTKGATLSRKASTVAHVLTKARFAKVARKAGYTAAVIDRLWGEHPANVEVESDRIGGAETDRRLASMLDNYAADGGSKTDPDVRPQPGAALSRVLGIPLPGALDGAAMGGQHSCGAMSCG